jgi:hypothetical protein
MSKTQIPACHLEIILFLRTVYGDGRKTTNKLQVLPEKYLVDLKHTFMKRWEQEVKFVPENYTQEFYMNKFFFNFPL